MTFLLGEDADHTGIEEMQKHDCKERGVFLALTQSQRSQQSGTDWKRQFWMFSMRRGRKLRFQIEI